MKKGTVKFYSLPDLDGQVKTRQAGKHQGHLGFRIASFAVGPATGLAFDPQGPAVETDEHGFCSNLERGHSELIDALYESRILSAQRFST